MERFRPKTAAPPADPEPAPVPAPVPKPRPDPVLCFVCLPNKLLKTPPIRYRDEPPKAGLSPFEFVIGATCAGLARAKLTDLRHVEAWRAANRAIQSQRREKMGVLGNEVFQTAGMGVYDETKNAFEYTAPTIKLEVAQRTLFRAAGLSRKASNLARLPATLDRLAKPIPGFAPSLQGWQMLPSGRIRLNVNSRWVPRTRFGYFAREAWPPPASGPTVLGLFLFLHGADLRPDSPTSIDIEKLYRLLGIPLTCSAHTARALNRALDITNKHLAELNENGALDQYELPTMFELVPVANGARVHIRPRVAKVEQVSKPEWDDHEQPDLESDGEPDDEDVKDARWRRFWQARHEDQQRTWQAQWAAEVEQYEREKAAKC